MDSTARVWHRFDRSYAVVIWLQLGHYIVLDKNFEGDQNMNPDQDDKTTTKHLVITFVLFVILGVFLVVGANMVG